METFWDEMRQLVPVQPAGRRSVHSQVQAALDSGWTPEGLVAWARRQLRNAQARGPVSNPAGFVISQLRQIPTPAESAAESAAEQGDQDSAARLPDWCGDASCHERTRMRETETGATYRCPQCNPRAITSSDGGAQQEATAARAGRSGTVSAETALADLGITA